MKKNVIIKLTAIALLFFAISCSETEDEMTISEEQPIQNNLDETVSNTSKTFCISEEHSSHSESFGIPNDLLLRSPNPDARGDQYVVRVKVWVLKKTDGTGGQSSSNVNAAIQHLEDDFAPHNIAFDIIGVEDIRSDALYNPLLTTFQLQMTNIISGQLGAPYRADDRIDIFLIPPVGGPDEGAGFAMREAFGAQGGSQFPGRSCGVGGFQEGINIVPTSVISHEVAHCLGVYHPSSSIIDDRHPQSLSSCSELIYGDGINRQYCGDLVMETTAQPGLNNVNQVNEANCTYVGNLTDDNGVPYTDVFLDNLMVRSVISCISNELLPGQVNRMKYVMTNNDLLHQVVSTSNSCNSASWRLAGKHGSGTLQSGSTVRYKLNTTTGGSISPNNYAFVRISATGSPVNVVYNGLSFGVQAGTSTDIRIEGYDECTSNPQIDFPLTFYRLFGFNSNVTVEVIEVSGQHTIAAKASESFALL